MLSLEDVKNYLRVDFDDDDALIESCFLRWPISTNTEKKPITMRSP